MPDKPEPVRPKKRKSGPPRRRDWQKTFLEEIEKNVVVGLACKAAGVSEKTFRRERHRDETFALAYHDAHERGLDALEAVLRLRATRGQPVRKRVTRTDKDGNVEVTETEELVISSTVGMFLLKRYRPEFRESFRVESTGPGGGPIQHEVRVERSLEDFYAELDELAADPPE